MTFRINMSAAELAADLDAEDFVTVVGVDTYPFYEHEGEQGGPLYGYGHQNKAEFAALANKYDETGLYTADDVGHGYGVVEPVWDQFYDWRYQHVSEPSENTIPITWLTRPATINHA